jgi:hypothetical protein
MNTMAELQTDLNATTFDITFILIAYPFTPADVLVQSLINLQYTILKINPLYTLTYRFLTLTSEEIRRFYLTNVTTEIPYLVTYKKKYMYRDPWWFPCKQVSLSSPIADINVYIRNSLAPLQRNTGNINRGYQPFVYGKAT